MILAYAATKKERNGLRKTLDAIPKQRLNTAIDTIIGEPFRWPYLPARRDKKVGELRPVHPAPTFQLGQIWFRGGRETTQSSAHLVHLDQITGTKMADYGKCPEEWKLCFRFVITVCAQRNDDRVGSGRRK